MIWATQSRETYPLLIQHPGARESPGVNLGQSDELRGRAYQSGLRGLASRDLDTCSEPRPLRKKYRSNHTVNR